MNSNAPAIVILNAFADAIRDGFAPQIGATVAIAQDPAHAVDLLGGVRPGASAIVLWYNSDFPVTDEPYETLVTARIACALIQNPGLAIPAAAPGLLAAADALRAYASAMELPQLADSRPRYAGMEPVPLRSGEALHGYTLSFELTYAAQCGEPQEQ
jgi:hypothetical protein